jgi:hypothetical protein
MVVTIHQPAYLPWLGYLDRIARSDLFIFLDSVQFERNSFTNRNRIKTADGPLGLTVPVRLRDHLNTTIADVEIDEQRDWRRKHLSSIAQSYRHAPGFSSRYERLAAVYASDTSRLAELCFDQLRFWLAELDIATRVVRASELPVEGRNSELLLALCSAATPSCCWRCADTPAPAPTSRGRSGGTICRSTRSPRRVSRCATTTMRIRITRSFMATSFLRWESWITG